MKGRRTFISEWTRMKNLSNMSFCSDFGHGASYLHVDVLKNTQIPRTWRYCLNRSLAEKLVNKGQNQLELDRFRDLMFVHYILQLEETNKKKRKAGGEIDSGGPSGSQSNKRQRSSTRSCAACFGSVNNAKNMNIP
ncbi:hypothetical protein D5086_003845 [Populus alba]|uniref:Uncharacterized protein n=1 Tax=Populus alba TaxID=43335 RepID=A0ACC4D7C0_POPAL